MRNILLILTIIALSASAAAAQSVARVKSRLSETSASGARIEIAEDSSTAAAVRQADAHPKPSGVKGYRVVIFFDNGQYASDKAKSVMSDFEEKFPSINAYMVYENPYFKVSVGDCLTMEEAVILMNRVGKAFPTAFPKSEEITLAELTQVKEEPAQRDPGDELPAEEGHSPSSAL